MNRYVVTAISFLVSTARINRKTLFLSIAMLPSNELQRGIKLGIVLPVDIAEHCCTKNSLKNVSFGVYVSNNDSIF